jgi:glycosyltransferase involved in cell wall biosynthesis
MLNDPGRLPSAHAVASEMTSRTVVQIVHAEAGGGVETLARMIEAELTRRGFTIETRVLYSRPDLPAAKKLAAVVKMAWQLLRNPPDALIAYQSTASLLIGVVGSLRGRRRVVHQTALPAETAAPFRILDRLAGAAGLYSANVLNTAATTSAFAGYPPSYLRYVRLIEHGIAPLPVATDPRSALARHGIPQDGRPVLINVGRLCSQKGQDRILSALLSLTDCRLVLVGSGPEEAAFRALAERLGVADRVHFLGMLARPELGALMQVANVFVFPSRWETFGLAAVEAAMAGVPVVASDIEVLREVLATLDARSVRFVTTDDAHALADAVRSILADPQAKVRARECSDAIRQRYSLQRMTDAYVALLST